MTRVDMALGLAALQLTNTTEHQYLDVGAIIVPLQILWMVAKNPLPQGQDCRI